MEYRPQRFALLPTVVKNLLIINGLLFLAKETMIYYGFDLEDILGLHYFKADKFEPYQLVTYMFMHGNFSHLFFNMFAIWMFGSTLENYWGPKKFLTYYLITGFGAALIHYTIVDFEINKTLGVLEAYLQNPGLEQLNQLFQVDQFRFLKPPGDYEFMEQYQLFDRAYRDLTFDPQNTKALHDISGFIIYYQEYFKNLPVVVGASGSLFGLLLAFGMLFPNAPLFIMFIPFPVKAKYFVIGYGLIELYSGLANNPSDNVAHFGHLGGMLFGYILLMFWKKRQKSHWS